MSQYRTVQVGNYRVEIHVWKAAPNPESLWLFEFDATTENGDTLPHFRPMDGECGKSAEEAFSAAIEYAKAALQR